MRVIEEELEPGRLGLLDSEARPAAQDTDQSYPRALNSALGMLARREHSEAELARKLNRKGFATDSVDKVLEYLISEKLQSDARFAESYVHGRIGRGYGPMTIRNELNQRGIDELLVEETLTRSAEFWIDVAQRARSKKFRSEQCEELGEDQDGACEDGNARFARAAAEKALWYKQARFLARRGFPADLIYRVLGSRG